MKKNEELDIKILDRNNSRFIIPEEAPFPNDNNPLKKEKKCSKLTSLQSKYGYVLVDENCLGSKKKGKKKKKKKKYKIVLKNEPFSFEVFRNDIHKDVVFNTTGKSFVYSKNYIELESQKPSQEIFGMGQRNYKFKLNQGTYTLWSVDALKIIENGTPGHNTYGVHPLYLMQEQKKKFHLVFMRNANAMDFTIDSNKLNYKIIGGIIHLKIFFGKYHPDSAIKLYHRYIGGFFLPPFWAMGFHQSRWGYNNLTILTDVVENYFKNQIPVDKKRLIPIIDVGIGHYDSSLTNLKIVLLNLFENDREQVYQNGEHYKIYLKNSINEYFEGRVWPGSVYFPDFTHPNISKFLRNQMKKFYKIFPYSGIWLDMNEISNFCDGECKESKNYYEKYIKYLEEKSEDDLYYIPGNKFLNEKSIGK